MCFSAIVRCLLLASVCSGGFVDNPHSQLDRLLLSMREYWFLRKMVVYYTEQKEFGHVSKLVSLGRKFSVKYLMGFHSMRGENLQLKKEALLNVIFAERNEDAGNLLQKIFTSGCSSCVVLLLLGKGVSLAPLLEGIHVPFGSKLLVLENENSTVVAEVLQESRNSSLKFAYSEDPVISSSLSSSWHKIPDLAGVPVLCSVVELSPQIIIKDGSLQKHGITGYIGDLWNLQTEILNFRPEYFERSAHIVSKAGEVDLYPAAPSSNKASRTTTVLFTSWYSLFVREPEETPSWESLVRPFSKYLWLVIFAAFLVLGLFLALVRVVGETACFLQHRSRCLYFRTSMLDVLQALCQQGSVASPRLFSGRLVLWLSFAFGLVIFTSYSAVLISHLAVHRVNLPFTSLEELARHSDFSLVLTQDSYEMAVFQRAKTGVLKEIWEKSFSPGGGNVAANLSDGIQKLCSPGRAFMETPEVISAHFIPCSIRSLRNYFPVQVSISMRRDWPHGDIVNYQFHRMREFGFFSYMKQKWIKDIPQPTSNRTVSSIGLSEICSMFFAYAFGVVLSFVIFILEIFVDTCK